MKKVWMVIIFLFPLQAWAEKPNPADFTVKVHVQSSSIQWECGVVFDGGSVCDWRQYLTVVIDGKKIELTGPTNNAKIHILPEPAMVLRTGDYVAKAVKQNDDRPYEYSLSYEFLFVDGGTRNYTVVGESE